MPALKHQAIIQILRDEPQLVATILGHLGFITPSGSYPVIADSDLSHRSSRLLKELRADNVFLFPGMDEKIAVVVEVQTTRPNGKRLGAWPCYVTSARAVHGCKAYMLVIATSRAASRGSADWIEIGQPGFRFRPFLTGGDRSLPRPGGLVYGPQWMMLNILAGRFSLSTHEARVFALVSIAQAPLDRREEYTNVILKCSRKRVRQALEELMSTTFKTPFIENLKAEGRAEGRAEEAATALFTVLAARAISIDKHTRARVSSATNPELLQLWITRAVTATTIEEIFADAPQAEASSAGLKTSSAEPWTPIVTDLP